MLGSLLWDTTYEGRHAMKSLGMTVHKFKFTLNKHQYELRYHFHRWCHLIQIPGRLVNEMLSCRNHCISRKDAESPWILLNYTLFDTLKLKWSDLSSAIKICFLLQNRRRLQAEWWPTEKWSTTENIHLLEINHLCAEEMLGSKTLLCNAFLGILSSIRPSPSFVYLRVYSHHFKVPNAT